MSAPTTKQKTQLLMLVCNSCFQSEEKEQIRSFLHDPNTTMKKANVVFYRLVREYEKRTGEKAKWYYFEFPKE